MKGFDLLKHAVRAKEIFGVLARHGFDDLLDQLDVPSGFWQRFVPSPAERRSTGERIRLALEELGPTFVKLGQLMSMRPETVPAPLIIELRKLQNHVPALPFAEIDAVLRAELDADPEMVFCEFDQNPIAAGSLAQVYRARLREGGSAVAVKVQRPNIVRNVHTDLELAAWLASQLHGRVASLQPFDLPAVVAEVRAGVLRELDFLNEARNQQYFNTLNPSPEEVFAPRVFNALTTERLLVMEFVAGTTVGNGSHPGVDPRALAAHGARSLVHQVLVTGFFHADPHAGNVLATPDGRLCLIDWGLAGHLTRRLRHALADFWQAAVEQDAERIVEIATSLAPPDALIDARVMEKEVTLALREDLNFAIGRQELGRAMLRLLFIFGRHGIPLSSDYSLMAKAVLSIEEVGRALDPDFDLRTHAGPILKSVQKERVGARAMGRRLRDLTRAALSGLHDLPGEIQRLVRRLGHDDLTINFNHRGLDDLDEAIKTSANRIALGVIIGSLIIGSSLIVTTRIPPLLFGYPALGIIGYILSALLGFYVIWDIIRHGRHR
ncbi:AarF/UbiB family protein [Opitutaceae bacterium]